MKKQMLAYRIEAPGQTARLMEVDVPRPSRGEALIKVAGNGLCHSDLGIMQARFPTPGWSSAFTLGHEVGGG